MSDHIPDGKKHSPAKSSLTQPIPIPAPEDDLQRLKMIQRATQNAPSLSPRQVAYLQRSLGNQAVSRLVRDRQPSAPLPEVTPTQSDSDVIQRNFDDDPQDFIDWMSQQKVFTSYTDSPAEKCQAAAVAIWKFLGQKNIAARYGGLLVWENANEDSFPTNHYVVIATIAGQDIVVDPTQGQFNGGQPMVAPIDQWASHFKSIMSDKYVKYKQGEWVPVHDFADIFGQTFVSMETHEYGHDAQVFNQPEDVMPVTGGGGQKKKKCYLTTACIEARGLPDDCVELTTLRAFRDHYIAHLPAGNMWIQTYYHHAPAIVASINRRPDALRIYNGLYRVIRRCVRLIRHEEYERAFALYVNMLIRLERQFTSPARA